MPITTQDLVNREVLACCISLVSTLANAAYTIPSKRHGMVDPIEELGALAEQASELSTPIKDWEESLLQNGWEHVAGGWRHMGDSGEGVPLSMQEAIDEAELDDPYQWEIFEHWIVSDWIADKLIEQGEKVDKDFTGLCIWARTTTGQAISMDGVMQRITAALNATA